MSVNCCKSFPKRRLVRSWALISEDSAFRHKVSASNCNWFLAAEQVAKHLPRHDSNEHSQNLSTSQDRGRAERGLRGGCQLSHHRNKQVQSHLGLFCFVLPFGARPYPDPIGSEQRTPKPRARNRNPGTREPGTRTRNAQPDLGTQNLERDPLK